MSVRRDIDQLLDAWEDGIDLPGITARSRQGARRQITSAVTSSNEKRRNLLRHMQAGKAEREEVQTAGFSFEGLSGGGGSASRDRPPGSASRPRDTGGDSIRNLPGRLRGLGEDVAGPMRRGAESARDVLSASGRTLTDAGREAVGQETDPRARHPAAARGQPHDATAPSAEGTPDWPRRHPVHSRLDPREGTRPGGRQIQDPRMVDPPRGRALLEEFMGTELRRDMDSLPADPQQPAAQAQGEALDAVAAAGGDTDQALATIAQQGPQQQRGPAPGSVGGLFGGGDPGVEIRGRQYGREPARPGHPHAEVTPSDVDEETHLIPSEVAAQLTDAEVRYLPEVVDAAARHDVPIGLIYGLLWEESRFRANAVSQLHPDGTKDRGIAQINDAELEAMGKSSAWAMSPHNSINLVAEKLASSYNRHGSWAAAMLRHSDGEHGEQQFLATGQMPSQASESYLSNILERAQLFDPMGDYSLEIPEIDPLDVRPIELASKEEVRERSRQIGHEVLGRDPTDAEMDLVVSAVHQTQRSEQKKMFDTQTSAQRIAETGGAYSPAGTWTPDDVGSVAEQIADAFGLRVSHHWRPHDANFGAPDSDHKYGMAVDFGGAHEDLIAMERWAREQPAFRYVAGIDDGSYSNHVHLSWFREGGPGNPTVDQRSLPLQLPGQGTLGPSAHAGADPSVPAGDAAPGVQVAPRAQHGHPASTPEAGHAAAGFSATSPVDTHATRRQAGSFSPQAAGPGEGMSGTVDAEWQQPTPMDVVIAEELRGIAPDEEGAKQIADTTGMFLDIIGAPQ